MKTRPRTADTSRSGGSGEQASPAKPAGAGLRPPAPAIKTEPRSSVAPLAADTDRIQPTGDGSSLPVPKNAVERYLGAFFLAGHAGRHHAVSHEGMPAHGLLGTLRSLRRGADKGLYTEHARDALLGNIDSMLPEAIHGARCEPFSAEKLSLVVKHASNVLFCKTFEEFLRLQRNNPAFAQLKNLETSLDAAGRLQLFFKLQEGILIHLAAIRTAIRHEMPKQGPCTEPDLTRTLEPMLFSRRELLRRQEEAISAFETPTIIVPKGLAPKRAPESAHPRLSGTLPDIHNLPERYQLKYGSKFKTWGRVQLPIPEDSFLQRVLFLPEVTQSQKIEKSDQLRLLGDAYVQGGTLASLDEALRCFDQSLALFAQHSCYTQRGLVYLRLARMTSDLSGPHLSQRLVRAQNDNAYRDFVAASSANRDDAKVNYVSATARLTDDKAATSEALSELTIITKRYKDYPDAPSLLFWQVVNALRLDKAKTCDLAQIEEAIGLFSQAELSTSYHHQLAASAPLNDYNLARRLLGHDANEKLLSLHMAAAGLYTQAADPPSLSCALLHLCHALERCRWLRQEYTLQSDVATDAGRKLDLQRKIAQQDRREFALLSKKASLYSNLRLWSCQAQELQAVLDKARACQWRAKVPRLCLSLGRAYLKQGKVEQAKAHFTEAAAHTTSAQVVRKSRKALDAIAASDTPKSSAARNRLERSVPLAFMNEHILNEVFQVLDDNEHACNNTQGFVWDNFAQSLLGAPSIKAWCEIILSQVRLSDTITPQRLLALATMADMQAHFPTAESLHDLQEHLTDALDRRLAMQASAHDTWLAKSELAESRLKQSEAFDNFCQTVHLLLEDVERIRPNSRSRAALEILLGHIHAPNGVDHVKVLEGFDVLVGHVEADARTFITENPKQACAKLGRLLTSALVNDVTFDTQRGVLTVAGQTMFVSTCIDSIAARVAKNPRIREVRLIAEHLYIDTDIRLRGKNLSLGADYIAWMMAKDNETSKPLTIDLSGQDGAKGQHWYAQRKAVSGVTSGQAGSRGLSGGFGKAGDAGGDLLIHSQATCVGLTPDAVAAINLGGGRGGDGTDGQAGGDGKAGANGKSPQGRRMDNFFGWDGSDLRSGEPGQQGGNAGDGGAPGLGGEGGLAGRLILKGAAQEAASADTVAQLVLRNPGAMGNDGKPGAGGKGALGGADGHDRVTLRRNFFLSHEDKDGYGLHFDGKYRENKEDWHDNHTREDTQARGQSHDGQQQQSASAARQRSHKVDVDVAGLAAQVQSHLRNPISASQRNALATATQAQARARDAVAILAGSGAELTTLMAESRALRQSTASAVAKMRQHRVAVEASRAAAGPSSSSREAQRVIRINYDGLPVHQASDDVLGLGYSPVSHPMGHALVVHAIEKDIDRVNATQGTCPKAVGKLVQSLADWVVANPKAASWQQERAQNLITFLVKLIEEADLYAWVGDIKEIKLDFSALGPQAQQKSWLGVKLMPRWPTTVGNSLHQLKAVVENKQEVAARASHLLAQANKITHSKVLAIRHTLRVRSALCRSFIADRLLRKIIAAKIGLDVPSLLGRETGWLQERLQQRVLRVLRQGTDAPGAQAEAELATSAVGLIDQLIARAERANKPGDIRGLQKLLRQIIAPEHAQIQQERRELDSHILGLNQGLLQHCAELAIDHASLADDWANQSLSDIVDIVRIQSSNQGAIPALAQPSPLRPASPQVAAPTLESMRTRLCTAVAAKNSGQRLQLHIERQLEQLRAHALEDPSLSLSRIESGLSYVYGELATSLEEEWLPLAGELAVAALSCPQKQMQGMLADLTGSKSPPDQDVALAIVRQIAGAPYTPAIHEAIEQQASRLPENAAQLESFCSAALSMLHARLVCTTAQILSECAAAPNANTPEQTSIFWQSLVQTWFEYPQLMDRAKLWQIISEATAWAHSAAQSEKPTAHGLASRIYTAFFPADSGPETSTDIDKVSDYLKSQLEIDLSPALSPGARAALFILLTHDLSPRATREAFQCVSTYAQKAPQSQENDDTALDFAKTELSVRLYEHKLQCEQRWAQLLAQTHRKLALAQQHAATRASLPIAPVQRLIAFIEQALAWVPADVRDTVLLQAVQQIDVDLGRLPAALQPVKQALMEHIGQCRPADGWDATLAARYNGSFAAAPESRAELLVQLVQSFAAPLPKGADPQRASQALMIAVDDADLSLEQQTRLYTHLIPLRDKLPAAQLCLAALQRSWAVQIDAVAQTHEQAQTQTLATLQQQQKQFRDKICQLTASPDVTQPSFHIANADLFVALLDQTFVTSNKDADLSQRIEIYRLAKEQGESLLRECSNGDTAMLQFAAYLRKTLRKQVRDDEGDDKALFAQLVSGIKLGDNTQLDTQSVDSAIAAIYALSWRGILPYYEDEKQSAFSLLHGHLSSLSTDISLNNDASYAALLACLKTKFEEHNVRSDAFVALDATEKHNIKVSTARGRIFERVYQWLASSPGSVQADAMLGLPQELSKICTNPSQALRDLPVVALDKTATKAVAAITSADSFDTLLAQALVGSQEIQASFITQCEQRLEPLLKLRTAQQVGEALDSGDDIRWAALYKLLNNSVESRLTNIPDKRIAVLRANVARLQRNIMLNEDAKAAQLRNCIQSTLKPAAAHWPAGSVVKRNMAAILAWRDDAGDDMRKFLQTLNGKDVGYLRGVLGLKSAMRAAAVFLGDEAFFGLANAINDAVAAEKIYFSVASLTQLWLALPNGVSLAEIQQAMSLSLPENWSTALRETQCLSAMQQVLAGMQEATAKTPPPGLTKAGLSQWCDGQLEEQAADYAKGMDKWQASLTALRQSDALKPHLRAFLLGLLARKLTGFAASGTSFPRAAFDEFIHELQDPGVLTLIANELDKPGSQITAQLQDKSFEAARNVISQTWILAILAPVMQDLGASEKTRVVALLMELAATRQKPMMKKVVGALVAGGQMTPNAVQAVANFTDRTFDLDDASLARMAGRSTHAQWFTDIAADTLAQRSRPRDASQIAALMAADSTAGNQSVGPWVTPEGDGLSKLQATLDSIKAALTKPTATNTKAIQAWSSEDIRHWATCQEGEPAHYSHRGPQIWPDPARLQEAMAVLYRSVQLQFALDLRDTQLAAILLMVRDGNASDKAGKLAQVATGEGKSLITGGVAILKALGGLNVDVITTSKVLAQRDANTNKPWFDLFDLRVANNCDDACLLGDGERSALQVRKERYFSHARPTDIIYGEAGAFEQDQLLTDFYPHDEDMQVIDKSRRDVATRCALVDEVDGLLLDNASTVLYLSHDVESLRHFEQLFVHIWRLANSYEWTPDAEVEEASTAAMARVIQAEIADGAIQLPGYDVPDARYMETKSFVDQRLTGWIKSAMLARALDPNREYIVVGGKKPSVVVIDKGTGVEQSSVKWNHGLHQFLQLKHGLELSVESLKALFLSNLFFFKSYGNRLLGLSGTLGAQSEQTCLKTLFGLDCFKLPRCYGEKYVQKPAVVASDMDAWASAIVAEVGAQRGNKRATLIVCDTIEDVLKLENKFKERLMGQKSAYSALYTYKSSHDSLPFLDHRNPQQLGAGDVIVATNLAGRGTDLKTSAALESAGGLHVILSYMPSNVRIQEQAFGRTARGKNCGTGQFIVHDPLGRPVHELCRVRDSAENRRLERVVQRDVRRIGLEQDLLQGFTHKTEKIGGFAALLKDASAQLKATGEPQYYIDAQIDSLKNRWAYWLESMDAKLEMVHVTGPDAIVRAYQDFANSVEAALTQKGWAKLIAEPAEWMKLGARYRRDMRWHEAERCYDKAAKDPAFAMAGYYKAACQLMHTPSLDGNVKKAFRTGTKAAAKWADGRMQVLQENAQIVSTLSEQARLQGHRGLGDPYEARTHEKLQIMQMVAQSLQGIVGDSLTPSALAKSRMIQDEAHAQQVLDALVEAGHSKPLRVAKHFTKHFAFDQGVLQHQGKAIPGFSRYAQAADKLAALLQNENAISQDAIATACSELTTRQNLGKALGLKATMRNQLRLQQLTDTWAGWGDIEGLNDDLRKALSKRYDTLLATYDKDHKQDEFAGLSHFKARFVWPEAPDAAICAAFVAALQKHAAVTEDCWVTFATSAIDSDRIYKDHKSARAAVQTAFASLSAPAAKALADAILEPTVHENSVCYRLQTGVFLSEVALFDSAHAAAKVLIATLEQKGGVKAPKMQLPRGNFKDALEEVKETLQKQTHLWGASTLPGSEAIQKVAVNIHKRVFGAHSAADAVEKQRIREAVDSVFSIIEPTLGILRSLDDKKVTIQFADIARAFFLDHSINVPPALHEFIETGFDVVASLIEKKDPPAWYETVTLVVMGMTQVVAGTLIKTFLPVAGEFLGNTLINTGMDDALFGITCAINGEFSWDDYWENKKSSLVSALKSAAMVSAASLASSTVKVGAHKAWAQQRLSHAGKLEKAGKLSSFNITSHVTKELGRTVANTCLSQVLSRGVGGMVDAISGTYAGEIRRSIEGSVNDKWQDVVMQVQALYGKVQDASETVGVLNNCIKDVLQAAGKEGTFSSLVRTSKPAISNAASSVAGGGWGQVAAGAADLASLGVSSFQMGFLVRDKVSDLARAVRKATAIKSQVRRVDQALDTNALRGSKSAFTDGLVNIFNGLLGSSVYGPLVAHSTQLATDKLVKSLLPNTQAENWASDPEAMDKILQDEASPQGAWHDTVLRDLKGASVEIDMRNQSAEDLAELNARTVENGDGKTLAQLQLEYGDQLNVFCDDAQRIYVQRPDVHNYVLAVVAGKPDSDPERLALAMIDGEPISLTNEATGEVKTYHPEGYVDGATVQSTTKLHLTPGPKGQLDHVSAPGETSEVSQGADCLYVSYLQAKGLSVTQESIAELRGKVAQRLQKDDTARLFFHNWSRDGQVKQFSGACNRNGPNSTFADAYDCLPDPSKVADAYDNFADKMHEHVDDAKSSNPRLFEFFGRAVTSLPVGPVGAALSQLMSPEDFSSTGAYIVESPLEIGRAGADMFRLGEGVLEGTLAGYSRDALRVAGGVTGILAGAKYGVQASRYVMNAHYVAEIRGFARLRLDPLLLDRSGAKLGQAIEEAFAARKAQTPTWYRLDARNIRVPGHGPSHKEGAIIRTLRLGKYDIHLYDREKIWWQDKVVIRNVGPNGKASELRTHSAHPTAPANANSRSGYTTRVTSGSNEYYPEGGGWRDNSGLTAHEKNLLHRPAGG